MCRILHSLKNDSRQKYAIKTKIILIVLLSKYNIVKSYEYWLEIYHGKVEDLGLIPKDATARFSIFYI